nr:hypothetical protein [Tanacetum cinerariifolium]
TMDTTIDQQVAMDEAFVPRFPGHCGRTRDLYAGILGNSRCPSSCYPIQDGQQEAHCESRIFQGHAPYLTLTDVNINKLYQPWISFATIINKCLTGKSSGYDSLRLSQAQILWGLYHKRNIDYAYIMWEDFVYQVEHKNQKKSNEMYYPQFTKVIIHPYMSKDPSIPRRNKVNWHYVRDDFMFSMIKLVSKDQNTQQFGALLPIKLTNDEIRNSNAYKVYYVVVTREATPKPKASVRRTRSGSDTSITPSTATASPRLTASAKGKQTAKASKAKSANEEGKDGDDDKEDEGDDGEEGNGDDDDDNDEDNDGEEGDDDDDDQEVVKNDDKNDAEESGDDDKEGEGDEQEYGEEDDDEETRNKESFDPIPQTPESNEDDGNGAEDIGLNLGEEEEHVEEEEEDELYKDVNINQGRGLQATLEVEDTHVTLTLVNPDGQQESSSVSSQSMTSMLNPTLDVGMELRSLEENFFEVMQTNQFAGVVSAILGIIQQYMDQQMNEAVKVVVQIQSDQLRDEAQREIDEFLRTIDENIKKIIKEQVKEQVKALVDAYESDKIILDTYRETITLKRRRDDDEDKDEEPSAGPDRGSKRRREGKEPDSASASSKTATRSAGRSTTGSRSRQASASESALAEEPVQTTSQIEEPSHPEFDTGADDQPIIQPSQHPECIQPWISELAKQADTRSSFDELMDTPLDFSNFLMNRLRVDTLTPELLAGPTYELMKGSCKSLIELEYHLEEVYKATTDQLDWVNPEGQQYPHNLLHPLPLIPDNRGLRVIPFAYFINNGLEYLRGGASSRKYTTSVMKTNAADHGHIKWIEDLVPRTMWIQEPIDYDKHALWGVSHWGRKRQQFYGFAVNRESARDVYSKRRIIAVTELKIME